MNAAMKNAIVAEWEILMDILFAVEDAESMSVEAVPMGLGWEVAA